MDIIPEKNCKTCGELKPLDKYPKCMRARDGRGGTCHSCRHIAAHYADLTTMRPQRRKLTDRYKANNRPVYLARKVEESAKYHRAAQRLPKTLTESEWNAIAEFYAGACAYCGIKPEKLVRCRIVAVSQGGGFVAQNVVPACRSCSASKKQRTVYPLTMHHVGQIGTVHTPTAVTAEHTAHTGRQIAGPSRRFSN